MAHRKALVLGATGGIGGEVARRLKANGWEIVALHRDAAKRAGADGFAWRQGDAMPAAEVMAAAEGAALIVHAVNPPGHQWAYLPDVAETMVRLVEKEGALEPFATFHMEGHWDEDGTRMIAAIRQASGRPDLPVGRFPWGLLTLAPPFVPLFRELREMRYLWQVPIRLTNARLVGLLGAEPRTPLESAVGATLADLDWLEPAKPQPRPAEQG
jgi:nucleoside-diphosphate-sugar epimerase